MSKKPKLPKDTLLIQIENEMKQMKRNISKPVKTERGLQRRAEQMGLKLPKYNNLTKAEKIIKQNEYLARRSQQQLKKHQRKKIIKKKKNKKRNYLQNNVNSFLFIVRKSNN